MINMLVEGKPIACHAVADAAGERRPKEAGYEALRTASRPQQRTLRILNLSLLVPGNLGSLTLRVAAIRTLQRARMRAKRVGIATIFGKIGPRRRENG